MSVDDPAFAQAWRRLHENLIDHHPDELIREVALEVLKGTCTWSEAANTSAYGDAIAAMAYTDDDIRGRDLLTEAREAYADPS